MTLEHAVLILLTLQTLNNEPQFRTLELFVINPLMALFWKDIVILAVIRSLLLSTLFVLDKTQNEIECLRRYLATVIATMMKI